MIGIVKVALSRPYTFIVMAMLILLFGVSAAVRTPVDIFPNIGIPVVAAVWSYSGLPPDDMAGRVVSIYERTLTTLVNDVEHVESQSLPGFGVVKIFFQPTVNINAALAQVTAMSQTVLKQMPAGITPPLMLSYNASSVPILQIALSSDKLSQTELFDTAFNFIRPQLTTVPGVAIPYPYGGKVRQLQIDLNQQALHNYGLSANDVTNALASQNLITPAGTEKIGSLEYTVDLTDSPKKIDDFNNLPIKTVNGTVVYMRDVAYAHNGSPPQTNVVHVGPKSAVLMTILKTGSASTLDVISGIRAKMPQIEKTLPDGLQLTLVGDQSVYVKDAVTGVIREGVIAAALTGFMILLFLGSWRSTLIITLSIPLAILASVIVLSILGETINVMTLGGLALAVGILVDDATVTIENINWHLEQGKQIEQAILDGAQQIVVPATVSLLCICIAFVPMFGLGGVAGYLFRPLAEAVAFALIASYVLSRTLVPTLANYLLRNQVHHGEGGPDAKPSRNPWVRFQQGFEHVFSNIRNYYHGLLTLGLKRRWWMIAGFLFFSLVSLGLTPFLGQNFFPDVDGGQIKLHVRAQVGTRLEEMSRISDRVSDAIRQMIPPSELTGMVQNVGLPVSGISITYGNSGTIGTSDADILITLAQDHAPTADYVDLLREKLPQLFPGVSFAFLPADIVTQVLNFGTPAPIDVQVAGFHLADNRVYANELLKKIAHIPGIADVRIQQAFQEPTLKVDFDRSLGGLVGLNEHDAATAMLTTLSGSSQVQPTYWLDPSNGVSYAVSIQTPQQDIETMSGLKNLPVATAASHQLLGGVAEISRERTNAVVTHYNVQPMIDIYATPHGRDLGSLATAINQAIQDTSKDVPRGATVTIRGQVTTMTSAYQQLFTGLAVAIVLIYLLIVVNFQSWMDPFVIVMALPSALAGIVWMLFTTGTTLSVPALTGAIMCMGVATANSILVISFARERLASGVDAMTAALDAGNTRFRPVLMTALAMIIGMIPMAIEPGENSPLGRAVIGGLIFATMATLFLVPAMFSIVHARDHEKTKKSDAGAPHDVHGGDVHDDQLPSQA